MSFQIQCKCSGTLFSIANSRGRMDGRCHICNAPYAGIFKSGSEKLKGVAEKVQGKDAVLHVGLWIKDEGVNK